MSGEISLRSLLRNLAPELNEGDFVFCTCADGVLPEGAQIVGSFREKEGLTLILDRREADRLGLHYAFVAAWITLTVHSALDAVGLTAAFSNALAKAGISCNVIAAYHHDHLFVAKTDAERAMEVLQSMSTQEK